MADFNPVMNVEKFKKAINKLPDDATQGEEFLAFRAPSAKNPKVIDIGLYVGKDMKADFSKDKGKYKNATQYKGVIHRSAKNPAKKLVLESKDSASQLKEVGKECLVTAKLKLAIVAIGPGEPEPSPTAEEILELGLTPDAGSLPQVPQTPPDRPKTAAPVKPSSIKQGLMTRVRTVKNKIDDVRKFDSKRADGYDTRLKTVATRLSGNDDATAHQITDGHLTSIEGEVWQDIAKNQIDARRTGIDETMRESFKVISSVTFRSGEGAHYNNMLNPNNEDAAFGTIIKRLQEVEQNPQDVEKLKGLELLCRSYVDQVQKFKGSTDADKKRADLARSMVQHARLTQQAIRYQGLGDPKTWTPTTEARASELQAEYFFEEGSLHAKQGEFGAKPLGADGGANQSWWIRRVDPAKRGEGGTRRFIFKPADVEEESVFGFKQGTLAPREVLAKSLSDTLLASSGIDVGVCPTTLANIDAAYLPGPDGKVENGPPRLGSMQQLAESKGTLMDLVYKEGDTEFFKTIQKDNVDELLVFDLISNACDRHAGNLMVGKDAEGNSKYIPIDHGLTMPDKKTLYSNRQRIVQNYFLLQDTTDPNKHRDQPLGNKTKEALLRLNPGQIKQQMRTARDQQRQAHPNMDDNFGDENLDVMQRSIEFLQKAAQRKFSAGDLVLITAKYCVDIHESKLQDLDKLLDRIELELPQHKKAQEELEAKLPMAMDGAFSESRYGVALQQLGWCLELDATDAHIWAKDNAVLANRIIKNQITNPSLQAQIDQLLQDVGGWNVALKSQFSPSDPPLKLLEGLKSIRERNDPELKLDSGELQAQYDQLGGEALYQQIKTQFPLKHSLVEIERKQPNTTEGQKKNALRGQVAVLRDWNAFQAEGGFEEFSKVAGMLQMQRATLTVSDALVRLREAKARNRQLDEVKDMAPSGLVQRQLKQIMAAIGKLTRPTVAQKFTLAARSIAQRLVGKGADPDKLLAEAVDLQSAVDKQLAFDAGWGSRLEVLRKAVGILVGQNHPSGAAIQGLLSEIDGAIDACQPDEAIKSFLALDKEIAKITGAKK